MNINELLEKYDLGETSLEEEKDIRLYFQTNNTDQKLDVYKSYFTFFDIYKNEKVELTIEEPTSSLKRYISMAAAILIAFSTYLLLPSSTTYTTGYGEQKNVRLEDGSNIQLNALSELIIE